MPTNAASSAAAFGVARRSVAPRTRSARCFASPSKLCIKSVSRSHDRRRRRRERIDVNAAKPDTAVDAADGPDHLPLFLPCDAYSSTRALVLSLLICGIGAGGGVGTLANLLSSVLSVADARAVAAFLVEAAQLAGVSLVFSRTTSSPQREKHPKEKEALFSFDLIRNKDIALGIAGGAVAVAAVAAADSLLPASSSSVPLSSTATDVATSTLAAASFPFGRAAMLVSGCALAPATEELVFRGLSLRALLLGRRGRGLSPSPPSSLPSLLLSSSPEIATSAAAFAAFHLPVLLSDGASGEAVRELPLLFVLGAALGATAVAANSRKGGGASFNLAAPIVAHALYNAAAYTVS